MDDILERLRQIVKEESKRRLERRKIWEKESFEFWASMTPDKAQSLLDDMESNPDKYRGMFLEISFGQVIRYPMSVVILKRTLKQILTNTRRNEQIL